MPHWFIDGAILVGAALMVYNIYGFIRFARDMRDEKAFGENRGILHLPVILLIFFLLGYLFVALVGKPDLMMSMILFFGSVFVQIMYRVLGGVTRRIKESDELEAKLLAETEANRTKSAFLATISHEFRTPLNVILGLDHILAREPGLSDDARDKVDKIDFGARHMLDLVNNILDINRMGSGVTEARRVPFDMRQALEQINASLPVVPVVLLRSPLFTS